MRLNRITQRLIHVMRNRSERTWKPGDLIVRIERIGVEGVAQPECPSELRTDLPGVLCVEIEVQEAEWLVRGQRKRLRRGRGHSMDELAERGEGIRTCSLQNDGKGRQCFLEVGRRKQAFVPGKTRIEIVHQVLRKDA